MEANEACDNGEANSDSAACTSQCQLAACGDSLILAGEETCDDGNTVDDDGCDSNCTETACGNGVVTSGEECDDGNLIDFDGCDADCTITECPPSVPEGTVCADDGIFCNGQEVCTEGFCVSNGNPCEEDGLSCTSVLCDDEEDVCNPLDSEYCLIDGACAQDLSRNPENACEYCDVTMATDGWQSFGDDLALNDASYWMDEGAALGASCGMGACSGGTVVCSTESLEELTCSSADLATSEVCNLLDDNCDGAYDEGFWVDSSNISDSGSEIDFPDGADADTPVYRTYLSSLTASSRVAFCQQVMLILSGLMQQKP